MKIIRIIALLFLCSLPAMGAVSPTGGGGSGGGGSATNVFFNENQFTTNSGKIAIRDEAALVSPALKYGNLYIQVDADRLVFKNANTDSVVASWDAATFDYWMIDHKFTNATISGASLFGPVVQSTARPSGNYSQLSTDMVILWDGTTPGNFIDLISSPAVGQTVTILNQGTESVSVNRIDGYIHCPTYGSGESFVLPSFRSVTLISVTGGVVSWSEVASDLAADLSTYATTNYVNSLLGQRTSFYFWPSNFQSQVTNELLSTTYNSTSTSNSFVVNANNQYAFKFCTTNTTSQILDGSLIIDFDANRSAVGGDAVTLTPEVYLSTNGVEYYEFPAAQPAVLTGTIAHFRSIVVVPSGLTVHSNTTVCVKFKTSAVGGAPVTAWIHGGGTHASILELPSVVNASSTTASSGTATNVSYGVLESTLSNGQVVDLSVYQIQYFTNNCPTNNLSLTFTNAVAGRAVQCYITGISTNAITNISYTWPGEARWFSWTNTYVSTNKVLLLSITPVRTNLIHVVGKEDAR